ncbi:MAG: DUF3179 domain-containing protein [Pararhodobacter sp.]
MHPLPLAGIVLSLALSGAAQRGAAQVPPDWEREFPLTDFSRATVDLSEIISGGPPRDGIPAIDDPRMLASAAETRLDPREPVLVLDPAGAPARAYPLRYLTWHEIVNDTAGGVPVAVTYCPLCNTGMVFDRRHADQVLSFGVSGRLRHSDMIMYDRETETWWQQATAEAVVGRFAGERLGQLPAWLDSWRGFRSEFPDGLVMDQPDWPRDYGVNPYAGYDTASRPFLYRGEDPPHGIHPLARVVRVGDKAWPLERLRLAGTLHEAGLVLEWTAGQASAMDSRRIAEGRDVGSVRVRDADGNAVVHDIPFAFAFHAFHPDGQWMLE